MSTPENPDFEFGIDRLQVIAKLRATADKLENGSVVISMETARVKDSQEFATHRLTVTFAEKLQPTTH